MIAILGDIHGLDGLLARRVAEAHAAGATAVIQVGDFGLWPNNGKYERAFDTIAKAAVDFPIDVNLIGGNHEHDDYIANWERMLAEIDRWAFLCAPHLRYIRRGAVREIDGRRIGFLGGAGSIDYKKRTPGENWFPGEQITDADVEALIKNTAGKPLDLLITHTPPQCVILRYFRSPLQMVEIAREYKVGQDWRDPSADQVERAWRAVGQPPLVCGHMHESLYDESFGAPVRVLDQHEMIAW